MIRHFFKSEGIDKQTTLQKAALNRQDEIHWHEHAHGESCNDGCFVPNGAAVEEGSV